MNRSGTDLEHKVMEYAQAVFFTQHWLLGLRFNPMPDSTERELNDGFCLQDVYSPVIGQGGAHWKTTRNKTKTGHCDNMYFGNSNDLFS